MPDLTKLLERLAESNGRIERIDAQRDTAMRKRDAVLRSAKAAGATWDDLLSTGISRATVQKALRRE